jgi:plasmid stabilization system protein ParE
MDETRYDIVVQQEALDGIDSAYRYIASENAEAALDWIDGLMSAIESLASHPARCPFAPENEFFRREIRQLIYGDRWNAYRVLFTIERDTVQVLHVRHGARRWLTESDSDA